MRRTSMLIAFVSMCSAALVLSSTAQARRVDDAGPATVNVAFNAKLGLKILVDSRGFSLYLFESEGKNRSTCYDECAAAWPPLTTVGAPIAGRGVKKKLLRTIKRKDGTRQVMYNHHALYTDAGSTELGLTADQQPGDVNGQGFGFWYVVSPKGKAIHKLP